jgi:hypothetical protein
MSIRSLCTVVTRHAWPVLSLLLSALSAAQEYEPRLEESEAVIEATLIQPTRFDFTDMPLSDVVGFIQETHQLPIQLDNKALADAGIGSDTVITRRVHGLKLCSALDLLLGELDMTYVVRDEVLLLTTKTEAENLLFTRVYPAADLVLPRDDGLVVVVDAGYRDLIESIMSSVQQTTWDEVGGPGTIKAHRQSQSLVISQTYHAHREIARLFESLRAIARRQAVGQQADREKAVDGGDAMVLKVYKLSQHLQAAAAGGQYALAGAPAGAAGPQSDAAEPKPAESARPAQASVPAAPPAAASKSPILRDLVQAIPVLIAPASWDNAGGKGAIHELNGAIVVSQTVEVHRQIRRLLEAL